MNIYIPDSAPALDICYLCKMLNSSWKKRLFLTPHCKLLFHFTMKEARLRETKKFACCPIPCRGGGWGGVWVWVTSGPSMVSPPLRKALNTQAWRSHSLGGFAAGIGKRELISFPMVILGMRKSSWFHSKNRASLGEIILTQQGRERGALGALRPRVPPQWPPCPSQPSNCCSVAHSCPTHCSPMDCSTTGFPVLHYPPELAQTHVHWVGDAVQPSHPLSPPSPPTFNLSQHQGLFQWVSSSHQVAKALELQPQQKFAFFAQASLGFYLFQSSILIFLESSTEIPEHMPFPSAVGQERRWSSPGLPWIGLTDTL